MLLNLGMFQSTVANLASYFSIPTIGALYSVPDVTDNVTEFFQKLTDFFKIGIPVYPDKYEEKGGNQIGEQVLVSGLGTDKPEGAGSGANVTVRRTLGGDVDASCGQLRKKVAENRA